MQHAVEVLTKRLEAYISQQARSADRLASLKQSHFMEMEEMLKQHKDFTLHIESVREALCLLKGEVK